MDQTDSMAAAVFASLSLSAAPESLPFYLNPFVPAHYRAVATNDLPPFLFRICHPTSFARLDDGWVHSGDASSRDNWKSSRRGLNSRNEAEAANALNRHLWWIDTEPGHSNLVSWTTSLLFALRFAFYKAHRGTPLGDIKLCIVNTQLFPERVFVRDVYLIEEYERHLPTPAQCFSRNGDAQTLTSLLALRRQNYFGEFLSQGALRIDGGSCVVSVADMVDRGLLRLLPELDTYDDELQWANWMKYERRKWEGPTRSLPLLAELGGLTELFKPSFCLPAAAALLSLQPRDPTDPNPIAFLVNVVAKYPDDATLKHYFDAISGRNPFLLNAPHRHLPDLAMPEVRQYSTIITNLAILREKKKESTPATALTQSGAQVEAESAQGSMAAWQQAWRCALPDMKASL
ncbi:hypothetical protein RB595_008365 [Gaeumannomyces hyphopodioides]